MERHDPFHEAAADYLLGDMPPEERTRFETLLAADPARGAELQTLADILTRLRSLPPVPAGPDMAASVLARIQVRAKRVQRLGRVAAALVLAATAVLFLDIALRRSAPLEPARPVSSSPQAAARAAAADAALAWLTGTQEADGAWNPGRWGGQDSSRTALTGMALRAFLRHDPHPTAATRQAAVDRAIAYLVAQQGKDGRIGGVSRGMACDHGIAAAALVEACAAGGRPALGPVVAKALQYIREHQLPSGAWGEARRDGGGNAWVSVWHLDALERAARHGLCQDAGALRRGLNWFSRVLADDAVIQGRRPGPHDFTVTAMGAFCLLSCASTPYAPPAPNRARITRAVIASADAARREDDLYRWLFIAAAAREGGVGELAPLVAELQNSLVLRRRDSGPLAGSWDPEGPLHAVGGRLYTTVLATLLLEPVARTAG